MRVTAFYILIIFIGLISHNVTAAPVTKHKHDGRMHSHLLPITGLKHFHKHMHNGRAHIHPYSEKNGVKHSHTTKNPRTKAWEKAVKHQHGGRPHTHPLPPSGIKHNHKHKHGSRSHIHPLPKDGANHNHQPGTKRPATYKNMYSQASMISGLNIKQQIEAVLRAPSSKIKSQTQTQTQTQTNNNKTSSNNKKQIKQNNISSKIDKIAKSKQTPQQIAESERKFSIALRYEHGSGVTQNLSQAFKWYLRAAKQGNAKAQFNLASMYENGEGVEHNIQQAINWLKTAAHNGEVNAQLKLGDKYARGKHVPKNIKKAIKWYKRAADQGDMRGRANLNYLHEERK